MATCTGCDGAKAVKEGKNWYTCGQCGGSGKTDD